MAHNWIRLLAEVGVLIACLSFFFSNRRFIDTPELLSGLATAHPHGQEDVSTPQFPVAPPGPPVNPDPAATTAPWRTQPFPALGNPPTLSGVLPLPLFPKAAAGTKNATTGPAESFEEQVERKRSHVPAYVSHTTSLPRFPPDKGPHYFMKTDMGPNPTDVVVYRWVCNAEIKYHFTFAVDREALQKALAPVAALHKSNTAIITFANLKYADIFMNWYLWLRRLHLRNVCIFALDAATKHWLEAHGIPTFGVYVKRLAAMWYARLIVLRSLAAKGVAFIHSDTDAIWLRDPFPQFFTNATAHMKFSQGTVAPPFLHRKWGFVLCGGLFSVRPTPLGEAWLQSVLESLMTNPTVPLQNTDQDSMNVALMHLSVKWTFVPNSTYLQPHPVNPQLKFLCSRREITGMFPGSTETVTLLPHHLFSRIPVRRESPCVLHLYTQGGPKQTAAKLAMLHQSKLWRLRPDWANVSFTDLDGWLDAITLP